MKMYFQSLQTKKIKFMTLFFCRQKTCKIQGEITRILFSYDVTKSHVDVAMIVGLFEQQLSKKRPKIFKITKKFTKRKNWNNDVIDPSNDVITSENKFFKNFCDILPSCKKIIFLAHLVFEIEGGGANTYAPPFV